MAANSDRNRFVLICAVLAVTTLAVFQQVRTFKFVNYDDPVYVYQNAHIQNGITGQSLKWAFVSGYAANWHPLTWLSHMLDWQLFGPDPAGHHIVNLIFHVANTLLLFLVLMKMTDALWQSAFVAALFALHPLHVESVAWVAERKDVLCTLFWLLTMWAYIRYARRPKITAYLLTAAFLALGLMAKPMLVTLPFVLLLLDYWPLDRLAPAASRKRKKQDKKFSLPYLLIEKAPLFAMALTSSIITYLVQQKGGAMLETQTYGLGIRIANASISYLQYILKMIWPARLAMFYPHAGQNISILYALLSAAVLAAVTVGVFWLGRTRRYLVTGWLWYLGTLIPVIGLVQVGSQSMSDRYSYITLTGLFLIIAYGLPDLLAALPYRKIALTAGAGISLAALSICTYFQLQFWADTITLCEHALKVTKGNYKAHFCMTDELQEQGYVDEAIWHNQEALRIKPDYVNALNGLGVALSKKGKIDEAVYYYHRALEIDPNEAAAHYNLGRALAAGGQFAEAVRHYTKAAQTIDTPEIHSDLSYALLKLGRFDEAISEYEKVLSAQPRNAVAHNDLGIALLQKGKVDEAINHFNRALQIDPGYAPAMNNLKLTLAEKQKLQNRTRQNTEK
jgi:tetratricopeptide (TPR) repeat protein